MMKLDLYFEKIKKKRLVRANDITNFFSFKNI